MIFVDQQYDIKSIERHYIGAMERLLLILSILHCIKVSHTITDIFNRKVKNHYIWYIGTSVFHGPISL